jgi:hypothetical protein
VEGKTEKKCMFIFRRHNAGKVIIKNCNKSLNVVTKSRDLSFIFRFVVPCSILCAWRRFRGKYFLLHQR